VQSLKKIVVVGPESTGKSTLCSQLAQHYNTLWVPEFARDYLEKNGTDYTYESLLTIAKGQVALEKEYTNKAMTITDNKQTATSHSLLFCDTDMYVMKVWCEFVFNKCHNWILNQIANRSYDLYLLCNVDLPWIKDDLREYPDLNTRAKLYHYYKDIMINQSTPWINISGNYEERFTKAIKGINSIIS
jgi:NadR type nicotinamide-nucleotide adenylyltransferase